LFDALIWPMRRPIKLIARTYGCAAAIALAAACGAGRAQSQDGISLDHYFRLFPHFPAEVKAEIRDGHVVVSWTKPPPAPEGHIGYERAIAAYKVYRLGIGEDRTLIGKTRALTFTDPTKPRPGQHLRYSIVVVPRSGNESVQSNAAEIEIPAK
jgi:hypothetical protein